MYEIRVIFSISGGACSGISFTYIIALHTRYMELSPFFDKQHVAAS